MSVLVCEGVFGQGWGIEITYRSGRELTGYFEQVLDDGIEVTIRGTVTKVAFDTIGRMRFLSAEGTTK